MAKDWHAGLIRDSKTDHIIIRFKEGGRWRFKTTPYRWSVEGDEAKARALAVEKERRVKDHAKYAEANRQVTLRSFAETWLTGRKENSSYQDDVFRLREYVFPVLGDMLMDEVRPRHLVELVRVLSKRPSERGGVLAPRTVRGAYGVVSSMFHEAVMQEVVRASPCVLRGRELPTIRDKDPEWRDTAVFTAEEVTQLVLEESIPLDRRVLYAIMFLGCTRFGEAAFLRWKHYRPDMEPLGCLHIVGTYNSKLKREKETKAQRPRRVPVAPLLARLLAEWKLSGWAADHGRAPTPEDLIVPSRRGPTEYRKVMNSLKRLKLDLKRLGLRERRQHDARRTWLSTVLAAGANETHAKWIAHGPPPTVLGSYTTMPWATLCRVVEGLETIGARTGATGRI